MPIYEYECLACKTRFERSQRFSDPPVAECPDCGGGVRRVLFPAGIVFKGSGWYITDSRKTPAGESGGGSDGKAEAKPAESKTEPTMSDSAVASAASSAKAG